MVLFAFSCRVLSSNSRSAWPFFRLRSLLIFQEVEGGNDKNWHRYSKFLHNLFQTEPSSRIVVVCWTCVMSFCGGTSCSFLTFARDNRMRDRWTILYSRPCSCNAMRKFTIYSGHTSQLCCHLSPAIIPYICRLSSLRSCHHSLSRQNIYLEHHQRVLHGSSSGNRTRSTHTAC